MPRLSRTKNTNINIFFLVLNIFLSFICRSQRVPLDVISTVLTKARKELNRSNRLHTSISDSRVRNSNVQKSKDASLESKSSHRNMRPFIESSVVETTNHRENSQHGAIRTTLKSTNATNISVHDDISYINHETSNTGLDKAEQTQKRLARNVKGTGTGTGISAGTSRGNAEPVGLGPPSGKDSYVNSIESDLPSEVRSGYMQSSKVNMGSECEEEEEQRQGKGYRDDNDDDDDYYYFEVDEVLQEQYYYSDDSECGYEDECSLNIDELMCCDENENEQLELIDCNYSEVVEVATTNKIERQLSSNSNESSDGAEDSREKMKSAYCSNDDDEVLNDYDDECSAYSYVEDDEDFECGYNDEDEGGGTEECQCECEYARNHFEPIALVDAGMDTDLNSGGSDHEDTSTSDPHSKPDLAIVFSWVALSSVPVESNDNRFRSNTIGSNNEFRAAVVSIRHFYPLIPIFLFTNAASTLDSDLEKAYNIHVVDVDLMKEAGLWDLFIEKGDSKVGFGSKPQSLIYGWERGILPDRVIFLDIDIIIGFSSDRFNIASMTQPLKYYDIAACFEGFAIGPGGAGVDVEYPAVGNGWEINTGVMALRKQALPLIRIWRDIFKHRYDDFQPFLSGEQQALMVALQENPKFRVFPLPNIYNFRRTNVWSSNGPPQPVIIQSHIFSDKRANVDAFRKIAHYSAISVIQDGLHHMKQDDSGPYHHLCDLLAG